MDGGKENAKNGEIKDLVAVEVDRRLSDPVYLQDQLLRLIGDRKSLIEEIRDLEREKEALAPVKSFYDRVTESDDWMEMAAAVKHLAYKGYGRNNTFKFLKRQRVLRCNNEPYQEYVELGYFKIIEEIFDDCYERTRIYHKTMVSQKGLDFIRKLIDAEVAA